MSRIEKRTRLPMTRPSLTHKAIIHTEKGTLEVFITVGVHPHDKRPRELFVTCNERKGSYDPWATALSLIWQMDPGSFLHTIQKFAHIRQADCGMSEDPRIGYAKSVYDYVARWLAATFLTPEQAMRCGVHSQETE